MNPQLIEAGKYFVPNKMSQYVAMLECIEFYFFMLGVCAAMRSFLPYGRIRSICNSIVHTFDDPIVHERVRGNSIIRSNGNSEQSDPGEWSGAGNSSGRMSRGGPALYTRTGNNANPQRRRKYRAQASWQ